jgi:peptidylprolyl isomerase
MLRPAIAYGVTGMRVGGVRSVRVSPKFTFNERDRNPDLPPTAMLRYEIELFEVTDKPDSGVFMADR